MAQTSTQHTQSNMPLILDSPIPVNKSAWGELFGSKPSYLEIANTNPNSSDVSTADTIKLMQQYSEEDSSSPEIQAIADEIRAKVMDDDNEGGLVEGVYDWVKENVIFVEDEDTLRKVFGVDRGVELLIKPSRLVSMRNPMGDCDDFSMLTRSLLINLGVSSNYITVAADRDNVGKWSHVYNMAHLSDGNDLPVDSSHGKYLGWEAPEISRKGLWKGKDNNNMDLGSLKGLGEIDWGAILEPIAKSGSSILASRFATPQLQPNMYIRNADGSIITNQGFPAGGLNLNSTGGGLNTTTILMIAAVGFGAFALMGRR